MNFEETNRALASNVTPKNKVANTCILPIVYFERTILLAIVEPIRVPMAIDDMMNPYKIGLF